MKKHCQRLHRKTPKTITVPCHTMKKILSKYTFVKIDFVSIDVEGHKKKGFGRTFRITSTLKIIESDKSKVESLKILKIFNDYRPI